MGNKINLENGLKQAVADLLSIKIEVHAWALVAGLVVLIVAVAL